MSEHVPALVVGGGVSGLVCTHALRKAGVEARLVEAGSHAGGVILSGRMDGYLIEGGPQSFTATPALLDVVRDLELTEELVEAPAKAARYVLVDGQLQQVPMSPPAFLGSSLFSMSTKWSLVRDAVGKSKAPAEEESVAAFVRRKFTEELLEKAVGPMVSGIYAGDPEQLSLRAAFPAVFEAEESLGSVIRGMKKKSKEPDGSQPAGRLLSFKNGNETLMRALAANLGSALRTGMEVLRIRNEGSGHGRRGSRFVLEALGAAGLETIIADRLVMATPADVAAHLLEQSAAEVQVPLREIVYAPMAVVSLGYAASSIGRTLDGFGFLVPRSAGIRILGSVWNSFLFPGRAPDGNVLMTTFIGGATDAAAVSLSDEELAAIAHQELVPILGITGEPSFSNVVRYERAIPQYNLGHTARVDRMEKSRASYKNLWLTGNYLQGPSVGACVEHAVKVARDVAK
ncbi:MAG TPA: protoporphyrinogen oxidase [Candidatus Saccharimonadales bacterium]|nr:protoporphyrinogen oxidase [Candidatus Saccharimonadales bacterium]